MQKVVELYTQRRSMGQLADEFRVTPINPEPPLVHFAFPVEIDALYAYAGGHNLMEYPPQFPHITSPASLLVATEHLSEEVECELDFGWPFKITADCSIILALYTNYTIDEKMLIDQDQEDAIRMVQEALRMDASVRPKWYFDVHDPWVPDE